MCTPDFTVLSATMLIDNNDLLYNTQYTGIQCLYTAAQNQRHCDALTGPGSALWLRFQACRQQSSLLISTSEARAAGHGKLAACKCVRT